jgi:diadenylate cyclase
MPFSESITSFFQSQSSQISSTAGLFWSSLTEAFSIIGAIDIFLVFAVLWWIFRRLRRTDLIKILPRLFLLLIISLAARLLGLWALFYLSGFLLLISLLAVASLYASEIKNILEIQWTKVPSDNKAHPVSTADIQHLIKALGETMAVLVRSQKSALIIIKKDKSLTRLADNGTKMNSQVKPELLIDFFSSGSVLSRGAAIIEGNRIISAGSTLWSPNAKVLFHTNNPDVVRVAKDLGAVVIIANKTIGDINLLDGDNVYKNLSPQDLLRLLQNIFIYNRQG